MVNDLCRKEEQLKVCLKNYVESKDSILRSSMTGHASAKGHPHFAFQQRILNSALESGN
jgi:hypothetical protein